MKDCILSYVIKDRQILKREAFDEILIDRGTSIYEIVRLQNRRILFLEDHLDRLFMSMHRKGLQPWISRKEIHSCLEQLVLENEADQGNIKFALNIQPGGERHSLAYFVKHYYPSADDYRNGVRLLTYPFEREDPNTKIWRPEFRKKVSRIINEKGVFDVLLLDSRGNIPETSKSNIFIIKDRTIITPPDEHILTGVTRKHVLKACHDQGFEVKMRPIPLSELKEIDGMFLTGTSIHVLPVCRVDNMEYPSGNSIIAGIMDQFNKAIKDYIQTNNTIL